MNETVALMVLAEVRNDRGRKYKSLIRDAWMDGNYYRDGLKAWESRLQQIRNTFGPSWLVAAKPPLKTSTVTIISIWSKIDSLEGKLRNRDKNVIYNVTVPTGATAEETLGAAFCLTNADDRPLHDSVCSTTAGDIMVLDTQYYLVERVGFRPVTVAEATQSQQLTSRDTSFGYDFMVKNNLIKTQP